MRMIALVLMICATMPSWCHQVPSPKINVTDLLNKLQSKDWTERSNAVDEISSDRTALRSREVQAALLNLLDQLNKEREEGPWATQKPSAQEANVGSGEDDEEGYGEYFSSVAELVDSFGDWNNPRQACIMVNAGHIDYPSSPTQATARAMVAMPCILLMSKNRLAFNRVVAIPMLVEALAKANGTLDSETARNAHQIIMNSLHDPDVFLRAGTVDALGRFGGLDMIPALKGVAETDPAPEEQDHSIRKSAAEAIAAIEKRVGNGQ